MNRCVKDKEWQIISIEYVIKNQWLTVRKDHVKQPGGIEISDYYVMEYPDWVSIIAITEGGLFVMERQYRHGIQTTCYEICGGTVEEGETPIEAAKRELLEETGFGGGKWSLYMKSTPNPAAMTNICYTFIAKGVKSLTKQRLDCTEDIDIILMSKEKLLSVMQSCEITQGVMLAPLWRWMFENL